MLGVAPHRVKRVSIVLMIIGGLYDWYTTVFSPSVELIDHFVAQVEPQIADAIHKYKTKKRTDILVEEDVDDEDGQPLAQEIESCGNLDSLTWDMKALFEEHFPNLQRRSALITVYSSFEYQLIELCTLFQREKGLTIEVTDLKDRGILQAANYLEKVARLDTNRGSRQWQTINHIRIVRNVFVHRDGRLLDAQGKRSKQEKNAIKGLEHIQSSESEIFLMPGFLPEVVRTFKSYFKLIDDSIQKTKPRSR